MSLNTFYYIYIYLLIALVVVLQVRGNLLGGDM